MARVSKSIAISTQDLAKVEEESKDFECNFSRTLEHIIQEYFKNK
jgi:hypothetical protein